VRICNRINTFGQNIYDEPHNSGSSTPTCYPASPRSVGGGSPINTRFLSEDNHCTLNVVQEETAEEDKGASGLHTGAEQEKGVSLGFGRSGSDKARTSFIGAVQQAQLLRGISPPTSSPGGRYSHPAGPAGRSSNSRRYQSHTHTDRQTDRQIDRQTDTHTHTHTHTQTQKEICSTNM
jgi:hypothetical protein